MAYITQGGFAEEVVEKNVRSILGFQFIKIYYKNCCLMPFPLSFSWNFVLQQAFMSPSL